jgi:peroxiredoxin
LLTKQIFLSFPENGLVEPFFGMVGLQNEEINVKRLTKNPVVLYFYTDSRGTHTPEFKNILLRNFS